jgi:hypothetical protein
MRAYTDLPGLAEIVLEESFVLSIEARPGVVVFEIDFVLTPRHPDYTPPSSSETECFRRGTLRLVDVRRLVWDEQGGRPATDASGEIDYGHIDSFEWDDGRFVLQGDWGSADVTADRVEATISSG